ncbi:hypothetical protein BDW72DRAFT_164361 [Aspergillus terricola var. indicus]
MLFMSIPPPRIWCQHYRRMLLYTRNIITPAGGRVARRVWSIVATRFRCSTLASNTIRSPVCHLLEFGFSIIQRIFAFQSLRSMRGATVLLPRSIHLAPLSGLMRSWAGNQTTIGQIHEIINKIQAQAGRIRRSSSKGDHRNGHQDSVWRIQETYHV